mmetsp:Transcript_40013/g.101639  ORF Transcript_40013/g.101639 Transcript_40013/m.101639 type:complete len:204 (+) Transcript_40013:417-1028(+)
MAVLEYGRQAGQRRRRERQRRHRALHPQAQIRAERRAEVPGARPGLAEADHCSRLDDERPRPQRRAHVPHCPRQARQVEPACATARGDDDGCSPGGSNRWNDARGPASDGGRLVLPGLRRPAVRPQPRVPQVRDCEPESRPVRAPETPRPGIGCHLSYLVANSGTTTLAAALAIILGGSLLERQVWQKSRSDSVSVLVAQTPR